MGGEEFALILPDTDQAKALIAAERLRCAVLDEFADDSVPITISFGIASFRDHGETAASLLRAADDALYEAKESGRNRSVIFSRDAQAGAQHGARNRDTRGSASSRSCSTSRQLSTCVSVAARGTRRPSVAMRR